MKNVDQRLTALYNEFVEAGKEGEFIDMLLYIVEHSPETARRRVAKEQQKEAERNERKEIRRAVQSIKNKMTIEERIKFLNTPYIEVPDELRDDRLVEHPQEFNFVRFANHSTGLQKETFAARLIRYMDSHGFATADENGTKLDLDRFSAICNEFAKDFDTKARPGHRPQKTRVTKRDLNNYINWNICPKVDKMTIISEAMGVDIGYLGGYGGNYPPKSGAYNVPFGGGPLGTKFRKKRSA